MQLPKGTSLRPMLFSTPMALANLENRKTETRRGLKPKLQWIINESTGGEECELNFDYIKYRDEDKPGMFGPDWVTWVNDTTEHITVLGQCPYGKPGDWLYQKETFCKYSERQSGIIGDLESPLIQKFTHKAGHFNKDIKRWKVSIHMPLLAARCFLLIESIGIERLQDITEAGAIAEGIEKYGPFGEYKGSKHPSGGGMRFRAYQKAARAYQDLWEDINGPDSWQQNPFVWVIKYKAHTLAEFEAAVGTTVIELDKLIIRK